MKEFLNDLWLDMKHSFECAKDNTSQLHLAEIISIASVAILSVIFAVTSVTSFKYVLLAVVFIVPVMIIAIAFYGLFLLGTRLTYFLLKKTRKND